MDLMDTEKSSSKSGRKSGRTRQQHAHSSQSYNNTLNTPDLAKLLHKLESPDNLAKPEVWEEVAKAMRRDDMDCTMENKQAIYNSVAHKLAAGLKTLKNGLDSLQREKRDWVQRDKQRRQQPIPTNSMTHGGMETSFVNKSRMIRFNVGGKSYSTSLSTITKYPDNMLGAMFSGRFNVPQEDDGSYFIDRDGQYFGIILNYLRDGSVDLSRNPLVLASIKREALFYGLTEFAKQISDWELVVDLLYQRQPTSATARRALIVDSMKAYPLNQTLQLQGLRELQKLAVNELPEKDVVIVEETNGTSWIMDLMDKYKYTSKEIIIECVKALSILSQNVENCNTIAEENGIELIIEAMETFSNVLVIQIHSCGVLWSLTYKDEMCDLVVDQKKDLRQILNAMELFPDCLELQVNACATLWNLAYIEPKIVTTLGERGLELILVSMRRYPTNLTLQRKAVGVLENLDAKDKVYVKIARKGGIDLILSAMERYPNNPDLQTGACGTLCNLASNGEIKTELKSKRCSYLISNAANRFKVKEADELLDIIVK